MYGTQILDMETMFKIQGWPLRRELILPPPLEECHVRSLVGNMISTPTIGKILMAMLASIAFHPQTSWATSPLASRDSGHEPQHVLKH